jgi:Mg2+ and Co2+ transporter CorA
MVQYRCEKTVMFSLRLDDKNVTSFRENSNMRVFNIQSQTVVEGAQLPQELPAEGFVWLAFGRREFELMQSQVQQLLDNVCHAQIVDLHLQDILNNQLPSHYDFTSNYNLLVFRRLAAGHSESDLSRPGEILHRTRERGGPPVLHRIDTSPVAFVVFERVLITVHPVDCAVLESYASRLLSAASIHTSHSSTRLPSGPADLMLRIISQMVDGYLNLRRELTRQLDHWQSELLNPKTRFNNWSALLDARLSLHYLDEICEDQRAAIQDWINALDGLPLYVNDSNYAFEMLKIRSRDVLEHIERVVHHVRRLEQSAETAVQMHFNVQSNRTNDVMRTLTVLTAIFLPLNLITGFFGMNFESFPAVHEETGLFWTEVSMLILGLALLLFFWRKRYLGESS